MPFTPFHFGLAALPGGAISRWCSFRLFCFANVAIDVEALYRLPLGRDPYHHWCHTYLVGPALCAALAIPVGRPLCRWASRWWNRNAIGSRLESIRLSESIATLPALVGAVVGGASHVFLDSIMHDDIRPLWPFSGENAAYGLIGTGALHGLMIGMGIAGLALFLRRCRR